MTSHRACARLAAGLLLGFALVAPVPGRGATLTPSVAPSVSSSVWKSDAERDVVPWRSIWAVR